MELNVVRQAFLETTEIKLECIWAVATRRVYIYTVYLFPPFNGSFVYSLMDYQFKWVQFQRKAEIMQILNTVIGNRLNNNMA